MVGALKNEEEIIENHDKKKGSRPGKIKSVGTSLDRENLKEKKKKLKWFSIC